MLNIISLFCHSRISRRIFWELWRRHPKAPSAAFGSRVEHGAIFEGHVKNIYISKGARVRSGAWIACLDPKAVVSVGEGSSVNRWAKIIAAEPDGFVKIGKHCSLHSFDVLYGFAGGLSIGDHVRVAANVMFLSSNYLFDDLEVPVAMQGSTSQGINIGSYVWIGAGSIILDGVRIGDNSVIGAGSIVTKDVPSGAVVTNNPANIRRFRGNKS